MQQKVFSESVFSESHGAVELLGARAQDAGELLIPAPRNNQTEAKGALRLLIGWFPPSLFGSLAMTGLQWNTFWFS